MWGARGPFLLAAAVVMAVVTPVVFVLRLLKNAINTLNIVFCNQCLYLLLCIVKNIAVHVMLIVGWPEPQPLWSNGTPAYWVLPESSCHCENNSHILLRLKHRNNREREKRLSTLYLELLINLDVWFF
jgi:hypothetical protein